VDDVEKENPARLLTKTKTAKTVFVVTVNYVKRIIDLGIYHPANTASNAVP
jgi:hypothetical protein